MRIEVDRLPGKYRDPVRLCYFEGRTHDDAAAALGWPVGTVRGRLSRAREMLRTRLGRRGIGVTPAAMAAALAAGGAVRAEVPPALREATLAATATGGTAAGAGVVALAASVARGLAAASAFKAAAILLAAVSLIAAGAGLVAVAGRQDGPQRQQQPPDGGPPARAGTPGVDRYGDPLPRGAIARLGTTRFRHGYGFFRVFFAPDGKTLITALEEVRFWDAATGRLLRSFDAGWEVVPSPDGGTLFAAGRGVLRAIDASTGREVRRATLDAADYRCRLAVSPDGGNLALLSPLDNMGSRKPAAVVILLDARTFAVRWRIEKDYPYAEELAFSPDGRLLAIAGLDRGGAALQHDGAEGVDDPAAGRRGRGGGAADPGRGVRRRVAGVLARRPDARRGGRRPDDPALRPGDRSGAAAPARSGAGRAAVARGERRPEGLRRHQGVRRREGARGVLPGLLARRQAAGLRPRGSRILRRTDRRPPDHALGRRCGAGGPPVRRPPEGDHLAGVLAGRQDAGLIGRRGPVARLWDVATGREVEHRPGHPGATTSTR